MPLKELKEVPLQPLHPPSRVDLHKIRLADSHSELRVSSFEALGCNFCTAGPRRALIAAQRDQLQCRHSHRHTYRHRDREAASE
eukprot:3372875-Rhodomonas_salina.1